MLWKYVFECYINTCQKYFWCLNTKNYCLNTDTKHPLSLFWNIYLPDNYYFKDLNIKKKWLIFRIWIKNTSKCNSWLKKPQKNESKSKQNWKGGSAPKRAWWHSWSADRHFLSADWPKCLARPRNLLIKIKSIFFEFLEIKMRFNSYLILFSLFFKHPNLYK